MEMQTIITTLQFSYRRALKFYEMNYIFIKFMGLNLKRSDSTYGYTGRFMKPHGQNIISLVKDINFYFPNNFFH